MGSLPSWWTLVANVAQDPHVVVFLKEAKSTAQTWSAGALCMKDDGGIHSWA